MSQKHPVKDPKAPRAQHGTSSEVRWNGGKGRQPYANQGVQEAGEPGGTAFAEGDRHELSGRNLNQFEQVRKKP